MQRRASGEHGKQQAQVTSAARRVPALAGRDASACSHAAISKEAPERGGEGEAEAGVTGAQAGSPAQRHRRLSSSNEATTKTTPSYPP